MMWKRLTAARVAILVAAAIVVACGGEQALLVSPRLDGAPPLGAVSDPAGAPVRPVKRQTALLAEETWSFDVDQNGIVDKHSSTGLTITVPPGAVTAPTRITVTALKGASVAYRFEPHGLQFVVPITLTQKLNGIRLARPLNVPQLFAGYFAGDSLTTDAASGDVRVIEILPVQIDIRGGSAVLHVRHFSGYTVASAVRDSIQDVR